MCMSICIWNSGDNIHQEVELSGEVGFKGKNERDFVVRRMSGILKRKQNISKDSGGGGGGFKRGAYRGGRNSGWAKTHSR